MGRAPDLSSLPRLTSPRPERERNATVQRSATQDATTTAPPRSPEAYWLIVGDEAGRTDALTLDLEGRRVALAVFGFEEEARIFSLRASGEGWRPRKITAGDLAELLSGPYADVGFVALDPSPEMVSQRMAAFVSLGRERFVHRLVEGTEYGRQRGRTRRPRRGYQRLSGSGGDPGERNEVTRRVALCCRTTDPEGDPGAGRANGRGMS